jgi:signal transduction histidine kinase
MLRLYLRFYLALLASLLLLVVATATLWHFTGGNMEPVGLTFARVVQNALPPADASADEQRRALTRLTSGLHGTVALFDRNGTLVTSVGENLPPAPDLEHRPALGVVTFERGTLTYVHLADGRWLAARLPSAFTHARVVFHLVLMLLAVAIGIAAYPIVRQISRRLERLQRGVESLGAGDLTARVPVEGRDEVARLAASFNRAAARIEKLMQGHKALLANASHELRTPLARIRLALELMKDTADPKLKRGLEQDIAELDWLVDEILLASRLDTVEGKPASEEVDLLALAAEECARYESVQLEGTVVTVHGDPRLLRRLLRNLLENARRHGSPPTHVRIGMHEPGTSPPPAPGPAGAAARALIRVWDAGPGVPPEDFERVFEPFYRGREAHDRGGAGLGLTLVREIARRHGGEAGCERMPDGRSCFVVLLPAEFAP